MERLLRFLLTGKLGLRFYCSVRFRMFLFPLSAAFPTSPMSFCISFPKFCGGTLAAALLLTLLPRAIAADDFTVLPPKTEGAPAGATMMYTYLKGLAFSALDRRDADFEKLKTVEQQQAWQQGRRETFLAALGGFPERTPLNAKVTGQLTYADYRAEKITFESQPGFVVTATLYLPLTPGPHPSVVHPTGHSEAGKGRDLYQQASILLAKNGIACLCYDPVGQGERRQLLAEDGPALYGTTQEHGIMGVGSTLLGTSVARYMIWDGMRAIDYLQSRSDLDPARIGAMGISGGGTMSSYLGALDERVAASAPGCYLTGFRRLLETLGPQDAEQNLFGQITNGLDHGDYVMMRAPRPTLVMAATKDYFDIVGAWNLFRQSKRFYTRLGYAERVDLIEPDTTHGFPTEMRVGATRWMRRWFLNSNEPITEGDIPFLAPEKLWSTPAGQVMRVTGARSLFDLNREWEQRLVAGRRQLWRDPAAGLREVRRVTGIRTLKELPAPQVTPGRTLERKGFSIHHVVLEPEPGIRLPALRFEPKGQTGNVEPVLYVHGAGKQVDARPDGPIEKLVLAGRTVLAVDVRGLGETGRPIGNDKYSQVIGGASRDVMLGELVGKSHVTMRAEDILVCARYLMSVNAGAKASRVALVANGETGVPALHAAALEPKIFSSVKLERTLVSWADVINTPQALNQKVNTVFGALRVYDLPDLVATLPRATTTISEPLNALGERVAQSP